MAEILIFIQINWVNLLGIAWFLVCFHGYAVYSSRAARQTNCLASVMHKYRLEWMQSLLKREVRVSDTSALLNLERAVTFFASTTLLVLAGLVAVLGSTDKAIVIITDLPFTSQVTKVEWELKLLLLIVLFVYAFFKFTWSLRQYGFATVMIVGTPMPDDEMSPQARNSYAVRNANMLSLAASNFNAGLRTYYFSMAALGWFINFWTFVILAAAMVLLLYRREFKSRTLAELITSAVD
jgi:uncharacterized membrane protein